jgi:hypothetical protein
MACVTQVSMAAPELNVYVDVFDDTAVIGIGLLREVCVRSKPLASSAAQCSRLKLVAVKNADYSSVYSLHVSVCLCPYSDSVCVSPTGRARPQRDRPLSKRQGGPSWRRG